MVHSNLVLYMLILNYNTYTLSDNLVIILSEQKIVPGMLLIYISNSIYITPQYGSSIVLKFSIRSHYKVQCIGHIFYIASWCGYNLETNMAVNLSFTC